MPLDTATATADGVQVTWSLAAPPDAVWRHLTDAHRLTEWLGRPVSGDVEAGQELVVDHGEGYLCRSTITVAEPPATLAMTWDFPDEPPSAVTFRLAPGPTSTHDGTQTSTLLTLRHDALGELAAPYLAGWITHLSYFEASVHADPLPTSAFWRIYETVERLAAD